jgi:hypothetical protein
MGCLAVEGTYDRMYALIDGAFAQASPSLTRKHDADAPGRSGHPVD